MEKAIADLNEASGQEAFWSLSLLLLNFGDFSKVFLSLPAQTHSVRLWGTRQGRVLKKLTEDGNVDGFAVTVVRVPTNLSRRLYNGAKETDTRLEVCLQNIHASFSLVVEPCRIKIE